MDETTEEQIREAILENLRSPKEVSSDGNTVISHSPSDLVKAAQYLSGVESTGSNGSGWGSLRPSRVVPPGAV